MIRDLIIKTPYNPGERLPPEREIAEMLDVTRTVVREALIMLEIKGLVEVRRGAVSMFLIAQAARTQTVRMPTSAMMPVLLSCYRRVSYWKVTSRNLPPCRLPAKISSKCVRHCNWKSVNWLPARRAAAKVVTCNSISPLPKRRITACWWSCSVSPGSGGKTIRCGSSCTAIWMTACIAKVVGRSQTDPRRVNQKRCPSGEAGNVAASGKR